MPKKQPASRTFDADHPFRLSEEDDTALYRLRGLVTLLGNLSGHGAGNPSATVNVEALHATCWLMEEQLDNIIGRYTLDYTARRP